MFAEKDLIAGDTVLIWKRNQRKVLYLGSAGLAHFISEDDAFKAAREFKTGRHFYFTIEDLNNFFTIEQPESKVVPLEKKVYDFVPVRCRDNDNELWKSDTSLIAVVPDAEYPYKVLLSCGKSSFFKRCEFR